MLSRVPLIQPYTIDILLEVFVTYVAKNFALLLCCAASNATFPLAAEAGLHGSITACRRNRSAPLGC